MPLGLGDALATCGTAAFSVLCVCMYVCKCVYVCMYVCNMYVHVCWEARRNGHKLYYSSLPPSVIPCARAYMYGV